MEMFLIGESGNPIPVSGKEAMKRGRRSSARVGVGLPKNSCSSSVREEILLMLHLASRTVKNGGELTSEKAERSDALSSRCA